MATVQATFIHVTDQSTIDQYGQWHRPIWPWWTEKGKVSWLRYLWAPLEAWHDNWIFYHLSYIGCRYSFPHWAMSSPINNVTCVVPNQQCHGMVRWSPDSPVRSHSVMIIRSLMTLCFVPTCFCIDISGGRYWNHCDHQNHFFPPNKKLPMYWSGLCQANGGFCYFVSNLELSFMSES